MRMGWKDLRELTIALAVNDGQHHDVCGCKVSARRRRKDSEENLQLRIAPTTVPTYGISTICQTLQQTVHTSQLHEEGDSRSKLDILAELQVLEKSNALNHGVLTVEGTVHVGNRLSRQDVCW